MKIRWRHEADEWNQEGLKSSSSEALQAIHNELENVGPIIVEHRLYRGSSSPSRFIFEDYEEFLTYLNEKTWAGDYIWIWSYAILCRDDNPLVYGKCPDDEGCIPRKGAY